MAFEPSKIDRFENGHQFVHGLPEREVIGLKVGDAEPRCADGMKGQHRRRNAESFDLGPDPSDWSGTNDNAHISFPEGMRQRGNPLDDIRTHRSRSRSGIAPRRWLCVAPPGGSRCGRGAHRLIESS